MKTEKEIKNKLDSLAHSANAMVAYIKKDKRNDNPFTRKIYYENLGMQRSLEWVLEE